MTTIANNYYHGVFMNIFNTGTLITGASGHGKSELALSLISRGHQLIADDNPYFYQTQNGDILGECPPLLQDFLHSRNLGMLNIRLLFGDKALLTKQKLQFIICLTQPNEKSPTLNLDVNSVSLPAFHPHLVLLVECAIRNFLLQQQGYYAEHEFAKHQKAAMHEC